jgi:molecular chaperone GrpE
LDSLDKIDGEDTFDESEDIPITEIPDFDDNDIDEDEIEFVDVDEDGVEKCVDEKEGLSQCEKDLDESRDEYVRLYAEFENYRKRVQKDKDEIRKYANETIIFDLLPSIDNLEIALKHADEESNKGFVEGVQMTLRELYRTFEKFGVMPILAVGEKFDPEIHHAMAQMESDEVEEGMIVAELRKGFMYNSKVLRAAMVSVSKKPEHKSGDEE